MSYNSFSCSIKNFDTIEVFINHINSEVHNIWPNRFSKQKIPTNLLEDRSTKRIKYCSMSDVVNVTL